MSQATLASLRRMQEDNPELVERLRNGDTAAIDEMVHAELPRIYNLCLRLSRNPSEAEVIASDAFVNAIRSLPTYRGELPVTTWIFRLAFATWKSHVRYEKRSLSRSKAARGDDDSGQIAGLGRPPEEWNSLPADHQLILQGLSLLNNEDRALIVLRDMEKRSYDEIAGLLGLQNSVAKLRLSRAREKLRLLYRRLGGRV
jgi:RNA polymerase sigma-70 factor, ECF subfamily